MASYTVVAGHDKVVQFREQSNLLDMEIMTLARQVHPTVVAGCDFHGLIGGIQSDGSEAGKCPLAIYSMNALHGSCYIFVCGSLEENLSRHLNTVKDLARFFAESWLSGRRSEPSLMTTSAKECAQMFKHLADTLPRRFQHHVTEIEEILPLLPSGDYPLVLTHGDLNEMNILVDPASGKITGVVDWAEASAQPFGFALYALDNTLGYMGPSGWKYYENADCLRKAFWTEFAALVGGLHQQTITYN
ncbi:Protein kinase-like protein [Cordyceps javanica]|uniref:Protein kinase-like protein n=1 Tax=Cordyceps javanica TaxID=43265 RepID=A0A545UW95_9HYPO|nr:Protein kinase-like protein [Cordyceps javanica]TQW04525.1 Protein kinase-like protein [Cordyceps javanica]